jgi:hypothetical protein
LAAWLGGAVVGLPAAAVLLVNNYRDRDADLRQGRRTLAARLGDAASERAYATLLLLPFALVLGMAWVTRTPAHCCRWTVARRSLPNYGLRLGNQAGDILLLIDNDRLQRSGSCRSPPFRNFRCVLRSGPSRRWSSLCILGAPKLESSRAPEDASFLG